MAWIRTIPYEEANERLKKLYDRVKGPDNNVDNIMMMHSLRPHTMEGHMAIYKHVLHHSANKVPKWFLETIGVWVSLLNDCHYCVDHHYQGLVHLLGDHDRARAIRAALDSQDTDNGPFENKEKAALRYAKVLTRAPLAASEAMVADVSGSAPSVDHPANRPDRAVESSANTMNSLAPSTVVTGSDTRPSPI